jgi:hypothetical protein
MVLLLANDILHFQDYYGCTEVAYTSVTKCPESATGYLRSACEDEQPCDIHRRIPVIANGVVFKNLYCAQCHDLGLNNITKWKVQISEESVSDVSLSTVLRMIFGKMNQGDNVHNGICTKFLAIPAEPKTYFLRHCQYNVYKYNDLENVNESEIVSSCNPNLRNSLKEFSVWDHECVIYNANVYARIPHMTETVRFKNMFCAKCNGVSESDFFCPPPIRINYPPKFDTYFHSSRGYDHFESHDVLMNPAATKQCDNGKIFDANTKTCILLRRCDLGHVEWDPRPIRSGVCVTYTRGWCRQRTPQHHNISHVYDNFV